MTSGLEVEGVNKSLGGREVLRGITFTIEKGRIGAIVGPSGSGKTTLLNVISGLLEPDSGRISVEGIVVGRNAGDQQVHIPPSQRGIGYVFQDYLLFPHMTIFENVAYGLRARHSSEAVVRDSVGGALAKVGLEHLREKRPSQVSGGERQRVALARAIVLEPKLLLLDEPLSALDRSTRESLRLELKRTFDELATTVVYVTHDLDEAFFLGQGIGILNSGRLSFFSSKSKLLGGMGHSTAEFLGFNLVRAKLLGVDGSGGLLQIAGWDPVTVPLINQSAKRIGGEVVVAVPPESVRILASGTGPGASARIDDVWEFKDRVQVVLVAAETKLVCEVSNLEFRHLSLNNGDSVRVTFDSALLLSDPGNEN